MASLAYKTLIVLAFFPLIGFSQVENQADRLQSELDFLKEEAQDLDVYVPEETNKQKNIWFAPNTQNQAIASDATEDSISLGMSAIKKTNHNASDEEMNQLLKEVEEIPTEFQPLKKRRFRSR